MASSESELKKISTDLNYISLKVQQLEERRKILCIFLELRERAEFGQTEEAAAHQQEINNIDNKLKELREKKAELQINYDSHLKAKEKHKEKETINTDQGVISNPSQSGTNIFYVEPPPSFSAPSVILDVEKLPPHPCRTQCPDCREFVETETFTSISSVTWLMCVILAMLGCVAGCCLIPFCVDALKSTTHRCPKCRTKLATIKRL
ncbi:lipopolysaccharide-induced tumor necrosis factor-alpha factor homolog [Odontesthes bonariensis]|uniref:lipopolysaccharide-induced tumor necrosis factor-alpha factor homolog n=1 Tax=Odontesthes bonariensis TaxID=219752 RepID=UPI003F584218